jgi:hypothetical protein
MDLDGLLVLRRPTPGPLLRVPLHYLLKAQGVLSISWWLRSLESGARAFSKRLQVFTFDRGMILALKAREDHITRGIKGSLVCVARLE